MESPTTVCHWTDRTNLSVTYFVNQIDQNIDAQKDYIRLQLDVNFRY